MRFLIILLAMMTSQAGLANDKYVSLPPELRLETDEEYDPYEDYTPLEPLSGSYVHGYAKGHPNFKQSWLERELGKSCATGFTFDRHPEVLTKEIDFWPDIKFWFFRHNGQALYIRLKQVGTEVRGCDVLLEPEIKIVRGLFLKNQLTTFRIDQEGLAKVKVLPSDGSFMTEIPGVLISDGLTAVRNADKRSKMGRQFFKEPFGKPFLEKVSEECFTIPSGLDSGISCYISDKEALFGLLTYSRFDYHVLSDRWDEDFSSYYAITEAKPRTKIDGRLFEWDRKITVAKLPEVKANE